MNREAHEYRLRRVFEVVSHLSEGNNKYFSIGRIYRTGKKEFWKRKENVPGTTASLEDCLDNLTGREQLKRVVGDLGYSTSNLKLYRLR